MFVYVPYFKVVVIDIDTFESTIADERHFGSKTEAEAYAKSQASKSRITVIVEM